MINGINDSDLHAKQLVKILSNGRYKINLIPCNTTCHMRYLSSSHARIASFRKILLSNGLSTIIRKSRGCNILASCGQLAGQTG